MYTNILKYNYKEWKQNIKADLNWNPPIDQEFIPHILPILASVPLVRNETTGKISPELTYKGIPDKIKTPNGIIDGDQVQALIGFTAIIRRSVLLPKTTQAKHPQYGLYTPLAMYAHKLYNNIGYDEWETKLSPYLHAFLGTTLYEAYKSAKENGKPELTAIGKLRIDALTFKSGLKKGTTDKITAHRCNLQNLDVKARNGDISKKKYSKYAVMSFLQLWICNAELRNDAMILDLFEWGNTPKPLDAIQDKAKLAELKAETTDVDELWDIL